jgi:hypothetical protein
MRLRFFAAMRRLSHELAARLSHIDYGRDAALLAFVEGGEEVLGVVRFSADLDKRAAEFAIAVRSAAQQRGIAPHLQRHAVNPSMSLSAPTTSPLQEQMRDDYATGLMGAQRELLQQNPSGVGRQQLEIGRELNGYTPK